MTELLIVLGVVVLGGLVGYLVGKWSLRTWDER